MLCNEPPVSPADIAEVARALAGTPAFTVTFERIGSFPGVLYLHPEPDDTLRAIIRRLIDAFPDTPPYGGTFLDPAPHLTVAKAPDEEALNRLEAEITGKLGPLFPLRFHVREVAIEEESENGVWSLCTALALR